MTYAEDFLTATQEITQTLRRINRLAFKYQTGNLSAEDFAVEVVNLLCEAQPRLPDLAAAV